MKTYQVGADKETANRYRLERGFSSFADWRRQNRAAFRDFNQRLNMRGEDKNRLRELIFFLEAEYDKYIRPNL